MNTTTNTRGVSEAMDVRAEAKRMHAEYVAGVPAGCGVVGNWDALVPTAKLHWTEQAADRIIAALSAPEPAAQGEAVNVPGYDVGWKIRGVTAYDVAARKGYRHPECVEAAIKAAPPAQPAERVPDWVGAGAA